MSPSRSRLSLHGVEYSSETSLARRISAKTAKTLDVCMSLGGICRPSIIVNGFWRSGTTWLQEVLAEATLAKTIFEPLSPQERLRAEAMRQLYDVNTESLQAIFPRADEGPSLWPWLDDTFHGKVSTDWTISLRCSVKESLRRRAVVKLVRGHFLLLDIHKRYQLPVIHVRRNPLAVASSLLRANWDWSFSHISVAKIFDLPELERFDQEALTRIACCWAITERHVARQYAGAPWLRLVRYEDLREHPQLEFSSILQSIGMRKRQQPDVARPSASSTGPNAANAKGEGNKLTPEQEQKAWHVIDSLFPEYRAS